MLDSISVNANSQYHRYDTGLPRIGSQHHRYGYVEPSKKFFLGSICFQAIKILRQLKGLLGEVQICLRQVYFWMSTFFYHVFMGKYKFSLGKYFFLGLVKFLFWWVNILLGRFFFFGESFFSSKNCFTCMRNKWTCPIKCVTCMWHSK